MLGASGNFDRVRWSVVAGHSFPCASGKCAGHWEPGHEIYIAQDWTTNEMVVRHEMLHDLIGRAGHPDPPFGSPCPLTWSTWQGDRAPLLQSLTHEIAGFYACGRPRAQKLVPSEPNRASGSAPGRQRRTSSTRRSAGTVWPARRRAC